MRRLVLSVALSFIATTSVAQAYLGLRAGPLISYGRGEIDRDPRVGYSIGLTGQFRVDRGVRLQPEVNYTRKGYDNISGSIERTFDFVEALFLVQLHGRKARPVMPYGVLGLGPAFLVAAERRLDGVVIDEFQERSSFDVVFATGFGVRFEQGPWLFSGELRLSHGILGAFNNLPLGLDSPKHFTAGLLLGAAYRLSPGRLNVPR